MYFKSFRKKNYNPNRNTIQSNFIYQNRISNKCLFIVGKCLNLDDVNSEPFYFYVSKWVL